MSADEKKPGWFCPACLEKDRVSVAPRAIRFKPACPHCGAAMKKVRRTAAASNREGQDG
jgi:Zn finger protein HypA/HybF involved in hydrogenase expression